MTYNLETDLKGSRENITVEDLQEILKQGRNFGDYIILTASDGSSLQAASERDGTFQLEYHKPDSQKLHSSQKLTLEQMEPVFLEFRKGKSNWDQSLEWKSVKAGSGCSPVILVTASFAAFVVFLFRH